MISFSEYQVFANSTNRYGIDLPPAVYYSLGLAGEAGEVVDKVKKVMRDHGGTYDSDTAKNIALELGDVLWYISQMAMEMGMSLEQIAQMNVDKLRDRQNRGVLGGSGDKR